MNKLLTALLCTIATLSLTACNTSPTKTSPKWELLAKNLYGMDIYLDRANIEPDPSHLNWYRVKYLTNYAAAEAHEPLSRIEYATVDCTKRKLRSDRYEGFSQYFAQGEIIRVEENDSEEFNLDLRGIPEERQITGVDIICWRPM